MATNRYLHTAVRISEMDTSYRIQNVTRRHHASQEDLRGSIGRAPRSPSRQFSCDRFASAVAGWPCGREAIRAA